MKQSEQDIALGRFLSLVLRHNPAAAFIRLDPHGWADVDALLAGCARAGKRIDRDTLARIVRENNKQRYCFNEDQTKIRANQGHSIAVDVELRQALPPALLYHGTTLRFLAEMQKNGITRQNRQHVHLSADRATARQVGGRHGSPVVLPIDAAAMERDGLPFWISENGVWLCERVPWKYVREQEIIYSSNHKKD